MAISASATKAYFVAEKLDANALELISDLLDLQLRPANLFEHVRDKLIATDSSSDETLLRNLIKG